jgi:hypothetical protein
MKILGLPKELIRNNNNNNHNIDNSKQIKDYLKYFNKRIPNNKSNNKYLICLLVFSIIIILYI